MTDKVPVYIRAASAVGPFGDYEADQRQPLTRDCPDTDLKPVVKQLLGQGLRQVSHLVELGIIGAVHLRNQLPESEAFDAGVYVATGLGETAKNTALFDQVMPPENGMASPFDFINSAANTTAFYVAKQWGLNTRNLTLTDDEFSFELVLERALSDLRHGRYPQALVGGLDERAWPHSNHTTRLALPEGGFVGEGSGWWFLDTRKTGAIGQLTGVVRLNTSRDLPVDEWVQQVQQSAQALLNTADGYTLLPGFRLTPEEIQAFTVNNTREVYPYTGTCGCFHTAAAFGLGSVFELPGDGERSCLHVMRKPSGKTVVVGMKVFA